MMLPFRRVRPFCLLAVRSLHPARQADRSCDRLGGECLVLAHVLVAALVHGHESVVHGLPRRKADDAVLMQIKEAFRLGGFLAVRSCVAVFDVALGRQAGLEADDR